MYKVLVLQLTTEMRRNQIAARSSVVSLLLSKLCTGGFTNVLRLTMKKSQHEGETWQICSSSSLHWICEVCFCFFNWFALYKARRNIPHWPDQLLQRFDKTIEKKENSCDKISIKFLILQAKTTTEIHRDMEQIFRDSCPSYTSVLWVFFF